MKNLKTGSLFLSVMLLAVALKPTTALSEILTGADKRVVTSYQGLELEGAFEVTLVQGDEESVVVDAAADVAELIITKVEGNTLRIYPDKKLKHSGKIALTVNFKNLKSIDCSGAIEIKSTGSLKFNDLSFDASGACKANMEINATSLDVDISGAGNTTFTGKVPKVDLDISGAGKFLASTLVADDYEIDISGAGNAEVNVTKVLDVEVSGTGNVRYSGDPKITKEISGTGQVSKM